MDVVEMLTGEAGVTTVRLRTFVAGVVPAESEQRTVGVTVDATDGVPDNVPVELPRLKPVWNAPAVISHAYGGTPPTQVNVWL